jgi:ABC-type transport system substrate-binding protein
VAQCQTRGAAGNTSVFRASRRSVIIAGLGVATACRGSSESVFAQSEGATPVADATPGSALGPELPAGVHLENGYAIPRSEPEAGGSVHMQRPGGFLRNLNPAAFAVDPQIPLSYLEPLVRPHPATLKPEPWLAESWAWHSDGRELSFQIRSGVTWHDGSPLTAFDAEFSFHVYHEDVASPVAGLFSLVDSVEAATESQLVVRFSDRPRCQSFPGHSTGSTGRRCHLLAARFQALIGSIRDRRGRDPGRCVTGVWQTSHLGETHTIGGDQAG